MNQSLSEKQKQLSCFSICPSHCFTSNVHVVGNILSLVWQLLKFRLKMQKLSKSSATGDFGCSHETGFASLSMCSRENTHTSSPAQPQSPTQNQSQRQFQHVKASKSMDLGTTQNQQPTGGESLLFICSAWWLHASFPHRQTDNSPADAWLLHQRHAPQSHVHLRTSNHLSLLHGKSGGCAHF